MFASTRMTAVVLAALLVWACVRLFSRRETAHLTGLPDESLAATFDSDLGNVVYRWSETDPRSERDRKRALFDFVYQTYDSSAWIPQSLFEQNVITQTVMGMWTQSFATRSAWYCGATTHGWWFEVVDRALPPDDPHLVEDQEIRSAGNVEHAFRLLVVHDLSQ